MFPFEVLEPVNIWLYTQIVFTRNTSDIKCEWAYVFVYFLHTMNQLPDSQEDSNQVSCNSIQFWH